MRFALRALSVATALGALTACASPAAVGPSAAARPEVAIDSGRVRGVAEDGVLAFKGMPFAAPPVGDLRWRAPQPVAKWAGVRDASQYGHDCMQLPFPSDAAPLGTEPAEDCLVTNVWRPVGAEEKLPVLVWIYGGGFVNGGSSPPTYSGARLASQGIVFVSFNYRVGRFGSFAHPQLTKANEDGGLLGNYGYMDQIAALKWVQANVAAFGGDPGNVTIVGESAGGASVHALVTSPLARGLFQKAVVQSGGGRGDLMGAGTVATAEKIGVAFAASKGVAADDPQALQKLRALTAEQVTDGLSLAALFSPGNGPRTFTGPITDGKLVVETPQQAYEAGRFSRVPMMIGATSDDIGGVEGMMIEPARFASGLVTEKGLPVYYYRFSYTAESARTPETKGAGHATEIPFFFDNARLKYGDKTTATDERVGKQSGTYLVNFAKTGDPNGAGLPVWPRYTKAGDEMMDFAADGAMKPGKDPWSAQLDKVAARHSAPR